MLVLDWDWGEEEGDVPRLTKALLCRGLLLLEELAVLVRGAK